MLLLSSQAREVGGAAAEANSAQVEDETRVERWLDRAIDRAATPRGGATVIAAITTTATVVCGLLMTAIDPKNFTTVGLGLWWAVQTVTTVGYGDHVPTSTAGRLVAALVMLLGLAFLSVVTAAITSSFVAQADERTRRTGGGAAPATEHDVRSINERLDRLEALLRESRG
ncbi:MAG: potassium channel family protein [Gaiellaceae bacterium]